MNKIRNFTIIVGVWSPHGGWTFSFLSSFYFNESSVRGIGQLYKNNRLQNNGWIKSETFTILVGACSHGGCVFWFLSSFYINEFDINAIEEYCLFQLIDGLSCLNASMHHETGAVGVHYCLPTSSSFTRVVTYSIFILEPFSNQLLHLVKLQHFYCLKWAHSFCICQFVFSFLPINSIGHDLYSWFEFWKESSWIIGFGVFEKMWILMVLMMKIDDLRHAYLVLLIKPSKCK